MPPALLVGVDGSTPSLTAAAWAAETAVLTGCRLRLLFVDAPPSGHESPTGPFDERRPGAVQMLRRTAQDLRARQPALEVDLELLCGRAVARLLAESVGSADGAVLVLGSPGADRFAGLPRGSTALAVAAHAGHPVVLVRDRRDRTVTGRHVVLALEPGPTRAPVVEFALLQAEARRLPLRVVHAWTPPALWVTWPIPPGEAERATAEDHVEQRLRDLVLPLAAGHPDVEVRFDTRTGDAAHLVVDEARHAGLLVLGHRRRATSAVGPVTRAAVARAACPVALVPHR